MTFEDTEKLVESLMKEFERCGISNPITIVEQISFLVYSRLLDFNETQEEKRLNGETFNSRFGRDEQHLRWSVFIKLPVEKIQTIVREEIYPSFQKCIDEEDRLPDLMKDITFQINDLELLSKVIQLIQTLPLEDCNRSGKLFDNFLEKMLLSKSMSFVITPRSLIQTAVEFLDPKPNEFICDPACGSGGFLASAMRYLTFDKICSDSRKIGRDAKDKRPPEMKHFASGDPENTIHKQIHGLEINATLLRLAAVNLMVHGVKYPLIRMLDSLGPSNDEFHQELAENYFDVVLLNPPFQIKYGLEFIHPKLLNQIRTDESELLFLVSAHRMLKKGGRAAVFLPDKFLYSYLNRHVELRKFLMEENNLKAVLSIPKIHAMLPFSVKSSIVIFEKGGGNLIK